MLNLIKTTDYGDVTGTSTTSFVPVSASSTRVTEIGYNNSQTTPQKFFPTQKTIKDISGNLLGMEQYFYDGNSNNNITNGSLTEKDTYTSFSTKIVEKNTYDTFGNVLTNINSRGATTTYTYDSYKMYPTTVTNALGQNTSILYDYNCGQAKQTTDANGLVSQTIYDAFCRPLTNTKNSFKLNDIIYNDTYLPDITIKKYFTESDTLSSINYYDGLGRIVKAKVENLNNGY